jgi:plastocyanin
MSRFAGSGRRKALTVFLLLFLLSGFPPGCGGPGGGSGPSGGRDKTPPEVSSAFPPSQSQDILLNTQVAAVFSEPLDPSTVNETTVQLLVVSPVPGTVRYNADLPSVTFTPDGDLAPDTQYILSISPQVEDKAGNPLEAIYNSVFTTGNGTDTDPPAVILTNPAPAATGVPVNGVVRTTFSENMDPTSIDGASFRVVNDADEAVRGTLGVAGKNAVFTPDKNLETGRTYTVTLTTGLEDLSGNALASDVTWTFTTGTTEDNIDPDVVSTDPPDGFVGLPLDGEISAVFSEPMDPATLNTDTFTVSRGAPVDGTVRYDTATQTATFSPAENLALDAAYTATITTGARDLAGNKLSAVKTWSFRTGPQVSIVSGAFSLCDKAYKPNPITIPAGSRLVWVNNDVLHHTVVSSDGLGCAPGNALPVGDRELDAGLNPGESFSHTFDVAGTYEYVCTIPGHTMRGTVIVE